MCWCWPAPAAIYHSFRSVTPSRRPAAAGAGGQAIALDTDQAAIAATIAGVAARHRLPRQAVTIALAAALQESKLHNLDYGDRNSVGIFQQRPSEGWGPATKLQDPVYATTRFFAALTQVRGYATMPVYQAAQDVQHSADGSAYEQWVSVAGQLAGYFTATRRTACPAGTRQPGRATWRARCGGRRRHSGHRGVKPW